MKKWLKFNFKFEKVSLCILCVMSCICALQLHQIKSLESNKNTSWWSNILNIVPCRIELLEQVTCKNNAAIILKEKGYKTKILAPVSSWGHSCGYSSHSKKNKMFYVNALVTSLCKEKIDIDTIITAKVIYDNKYNFDCFSTKLNNNGDSFIETIQIMPLQNEDLYFIAEIPNEFIANNKPLHLEIKIGNRKYKMNLK